MEFKITQHKGWTITEKHGRWYLEHMTGSTGFFTIEAAMSFVDKMVDQGSKPIKATTHSYKGWSIREIEGEEKFFVVGLPTPLKSMKAAKHYIDQKDARGTKPPSGTSPTRLNIPVFVTTKSRFKAAPPPQKRKKTLMDPVSSKGHGAADYIERHAKKLAAKAKTNSKGKE